MIPTARPAHLDLIGRKRPRASRNPIDLGLIQRQLPAGRHARAEDVGHGDERMVLTHGALFASFRCAVLRDPQQFRMRVAHLVTCNHTFAHLSKRPPALESIVDRANAFSGVTCRNTRVKSHGDTIVPTSGVDPRCPAYRPPWPGTSPRRFAHQ